MYGNKNQNVQRSKVNPVLEGGGRGYDPCYREVSHLQIKKLCIPKSLSIDFCKHDIKK